MGRFSTILFGMCLGAAGVYCSHEYHFVRARDEFLFVHKQAPTWHDIYVDIRGWSPTDWQAHPELSQNLAASGHAHLLGYDAGDGMIQNSRTAFDERRGSFDERRGAFDERRDTRDTFGERRAEPSAHLPQYPRR